MSANEFDGILSSASWRTSPSSAGDESHPADHDEHTIAQVLPSDDDDDDGGATIMAMEPDVPLLSPTGQGKASVPPPAAPPTAPPAAQAPAAQAPAAQAPAAQAATAKPGDASEVELPRPGARIDQYEVIRELGRGGMGAVFLARDTKLARRVAIKFLITGQQEVTQRFFQEAQATAQFNHENIVVIHDYGEYQKNPYMVLEFLQGRPLSDLLRKGEKLPATRAVEIVIPVLKALHAAHHYNIVHRDLKPDNIFITDAGTIKVLDFGIAKIMQSDDATRASQLLDQGRSSALPESVQRELNAMDQDRFTGATGMTGMTGVTGMTGAVTELTRQGAIMGTLPYMSPEQWGIDTVDHRTDLWAIGILLFRMIAGHHPLHPLRGKQLVVTAMLSEPMPPMRQKVPDVDPALAEVIDRCLVKYKEERIGSAMELLQALEPFGPGRAFTQTWNQDRSPYAGLSAFQEADAGRFFGRSREIASAATRLRDQPLLGIVGPSGVGKSSFIRAGVVPALKQSGEAWETVVVRPGRQPMKALANAMASLTSSSQTTNTTFGALAAAPEEQEDMARRLYKEPGYLGSVLRERAREHGRNIMVFIDQFEELYTLVPDYNERRTFTSCLAGVADDATAPLRVVISIRSDFIDRVAEDPDFMAELTQSLFFLTPPNRAGLREALAMPAEMAGYRFETEAMLDDMLDHLENTPGALPLLQFAATKLWDSRDVGRKLLTEESYRALGGIMGALASHADSVLAELPPSAQRLVRAIFLRLVTPERTRDIVSVGELYELSRDPAEVQRLVDHLVSARLLVVQTGDMGGNAAGAQVEIVHESMVHSWPTLHRWLEENQDDAAFLEQLRNAARQWQVKGYPQGLLWRGEAMEEAQRWHKRYRGELPELQKAYLHAVFSLGRRAIRRKRMALSAIIIVLTLMVAAAGVALFLIRGAEQKAQADAERAVKAEKLALDESEKAKRAATEAEQALASLKAEVAAREEAEADKRQAQSEREAAYQRLQEANAGLAEALEKAESAKRRARRAKSRAEDSANEAVVAQQEAEAERKRAEQLYEREKERYKRVLEKTGSTRMDELKK